MSQLRWGTEAPNDTAAARERLIDAAEACFQRFGVMKTTVNGSTFQAIFENRSCWSRGSCVLPRS